MGNEPKIGEVWKHNVTGKKVCIMNVKDGVVFIYTHECDVSYISLVGFYSFFEKTRQVFDLDPLTLMLNSKD